MAQLIGLQEDPGDAFSPFEAELRRRLWYHICGLESRGAEEGGARQNSIMEDRDVRLPSNLNDIDLDPQLNDPLKPRSGVTDMTFVLARWESIRTVYNLFRIKKKYKTSGQSLDSAELKAEQQKVIEEHKLRCGTYYLRHLDESRPMDWMCIQWIRLMGVRAITCNHAPCSNFSSQIKCRLIVEYPFGQVPTKEMTPQARHDLLQSSVEIIRISHSLRPNRGIDDWVWYYRGWVQWHSIAIVIAELGGNKNQHFVNTAWAVLDPILADWDSVYRAKRDEPAWTHVNALIEKARQMRRQLPLPGIHETQGSARNQSAQTQVHTHASQQDYMLDPQQSQTQASGVMGLVPNSAWQSEWDLSNGIDMSPATIVPQYQPTGYPTPTQQQYQTFAVPVTSQVEVPFQTGCAPAMSGLDFADFGYIAGLDNIDFSAFDAVFKDTAWDFSSPSTDPSIEQFHAQ